MALKPVSTLLIDSASLAPVFVDASEKTKFDSATRTSTQAVRRNDDGTEVPLFTVNCLVTQADGTKGTISVTVPHKPEGITDYSPVQFVNLRAGQYGMANDGGKVASGFFFSADQVRPQTAHKNAQG